MRIEEPDHAVLQSTSGLDTIGEFYQNLRNKLIAVCDKVGHKALFGMKRQQMPLSEYYYGGGGKVVKVEDLETALAALSIIAEQGEGLLASNILSGNQARFGQAKEPAHFYRFRQIVEGRYYRKDDNVYGRPGGANLTVNWEAVYPIGKPAYERTQFSIEMREILEGFERTFEKFLCELELGLGTNPRKMEEATHTMFQLRDLVRSLVKTPDEREPNTTMCPPFWFVVAA